MVWRDPAIPEAPRPVGFAGGSLNDAAAAAAPIALEWGSKLASKAMADSIITGVPNLALAAAGVWAWATFRPRRRRRPRGFDADED